MRRFIVAICCTLVASSAWADITTAEKERLSEAAAVLQARAETPEHEIPTDTANRAACVIVMPSVKKAAFIVGGEFGKGVLTCRTDRGWSAPAFVQLDKGSVGFQAGAEEIELVLLVMNRRGLDRLLRDKVTLGAGMSVAAGPVGGTASAGTDAQFRAEILSYSRSRGAFIGADISGGLLGADMHANRTVYGPDRPAQDIVAGQVEPPAEARAFLDAVQREFGSGAHATGSR
jgi:lipid-binding SYLF domain-containing protein